MKIIRHEVAVMDGKNVVFVNLNEASRLFHGKEIITLPEFKNIITTENVAAKSVMMDQSFNLLLDMLPKGIVTKYDKEGTTSHKLNILESNKIFLSETIKKRMYVFKRKRNTRFHKNMNNNIYLRPVNDFILDFVKEIGLHLKTEKDVNTFQQILDAHNDTMSNHIFVTGRIAKISKEHIVSIEKHNQLCRDYDNILQERDNAIAKVVNIEVEHKRLIDEITQLKATNKRLSCRNETLIVENKRLNKLGFRSHAKLAFKALFKGNL